MTIFLFKHAIRIDLDLDHDDPFGAWTKINLQERKQIRNKTKEDVLRSIIAKVGFYVGQEGVGEKGHIKWQYHEVRL